MAPLGKVAEVQAVVRELERGHTVFLAFMLPACYLLFLAPFPTVQELPVSVESLGTWAVSIASLHLLQNKAVEFGIGVDQCRIRQLNTWFALTCVMK